jgi:hypothetical protein
MKIVITKCLNKIKLASAIRSHIIQRNLSLEETMKIVNNLPYTNENVWGPDHQEELTSAFKDVAEFHFEKSKEEQDEEDYNNMMKLKSADVINWYNNLSKEDKARVDFMLEHNAPCGTA